MKKQILLILTGLLLMGCEKDEGPTINSKIQGKWEWKESIGGMDGVTIHNPETDNLTRQMIFSKNKVVITLNQSDTVQNTSYKIQKEKSILTHNTHDILTIDYVFYDQYKNSSFIFPMRYIIRQVDGNILQLDDDVYDGYGHTYVRD